MRSQQAFTLIELMIVVSIIAMLATLAMPSYQDRMIRSQVSEGLVLAGFAQQAVEAYRARHQRLPTDNAAAGLPAPELVVGNYVDALTVTDGVLTITYGNRANRHLRGQKLALRPAVVPAHAVVPIAWVCGNASVPERMQVAGINTTTLPATQLPVDCR